MGSSPTLTRPRDEGLAVDADERKSKYPEFFLAKPDVSVESSFGGKKNKLCVALSRYEKMCVLHVRKKLSHLQLGSQSDEYG